MENIKSNYLIEFLFYYITERRKLELIIYSKRHQKKLNVELTNYKFFTERYKVAPKNGKGKEYNGKNDQLIFEGIYKNGKRNGKGKEYNNRGKLIFEGEYLNGKRNGKAKEFYDNGKIKFEGEYINGNIWNGNIYNINGVIECEIKDGNGKVKEYYKHGKLEFEGEYLNGERNGKGKEYY